MLNVIASTSARFAVAEYLLECAQERDNFMVVPCAFIDDYERELEEERERIEREREAQRKERYAEIKAKYNANGFYALTREEFNFMYDYEDEQWRNSDSYARTLAWLEDPANWDDPCYSDIYKDVHGFRPRFRCGRGYWSY